MSQIIATIGSVRIRTTPGRPGAYFEAGLAIDADGAPNAYHPLNRGALDYLANAGHVGNWWGVVTDNDRKDGAPVVQKASDPYPGFYVSATALADPGMARTDPKRYVNSDAVPYLALPSEALKAIGAKVGDFAFCVNKAGGACSAAIVADVGPKGKLGEGSIELARRLRIASSPKNGGTNSGVVFLIFPGSGNGRPRPVAEIEAQSTSLLHGWGTVEELSRIANASD